jgi:hypothetical protein
MSERTRGSHTNGTHHEALDLTNLHTSKSQESLRNEITDAANTDLSSASIQSISVVRLSARPEKRKISSLNVTTVPDLDDTREQNQLARPQQTRGSNHGILKNPYFPYQGGPLERLITLMANLLKHLERSLLASLRPQVQPQHPPQTKSKTKKRDASGREIDEEDDLTNESKTPRSISSRQTD